GLRLGKHLAMPEVPGSRNALRVEYRTIGHRLHVETTTRRDLTGRSPSPHDQNITNAFPHRLQTHAVSLAVSHLLVRPFLSWGSHMSPGFEKARSGLGFRPCSSVI